MFAGILQWRRRFAHAPCPGLPKQAMVPRHRVCVPSSLILGIAAGGGEAEDVRFLSGLVEGFTYYQTLSNNF